MENLAFDEQAWEQADIHLVDIAFKIKILGALSVGDDRKRSIPALLPS